MEPRKEEFEYRKEDFEYLVQTIRETVEWIDSLSMAEKDPPLIELGEGLKATLKAYDAHQ